MSPAPQCRTRIIVRALAVLATLTATVAAVAHEVSPAERAIEYRKAVYHVIAWNFGGMAAVIKGKAPYDKDAFALAASRVATLAPMLPEGFPAGSLLAGKTDAKPEIWTDPAEFDRFMKNLATRSAALADVAKSGDLARIKPAFGELAQACKDCHEKFRKD